MKIVDYRAFIEDNFLIRDKEGQVRPFALNQVQATFLEALLHDYPTLQGIRENILKARQEGFSSLIDAVLTVDFILSALKKIPIISGQIISHKETETRILFRRVDFYLESFLSKHKIRRADIFKTDSDAYLEAKSGAELYIGTAGAKTLGRGGTLQNIHWSEVAFYPNTAVLNATEIVPPAEQQVKDGIGKIFRESTGNRMYDFFHDEYWAGKKGKGDFKSRFFPWHLVEEYRREAPPDFQPDEEERGFIDKLGLSLEQVYWWHQKVKTKPKDGDVLKARREYPTTDLEAFLAAGEQYFDAKSLLDYQQRFAMQPLLKGNIYA